MDLKEKKSLIVGLGNPGESYRFTRHNLGQIMLYFFAEKYSIPFKNEKSHFGFIGSAVLNNVKVILLFPTLYMNLSGKSVVKCINYFKVPLQNLLILSDDIHLPFGSMRFRDKGSSGGHNGLKDIEDKLGTNQYNRLRFGIGQPINANLEKYVLSAFDAEEKSKIPDLAITGIECINKWLFHEQKENI